MKKGTISGLVLGIGISMMYLSIYFTNWSISNKYAAAGVFSLIFGVSLAILEFHKSGEN